MEQNIIISLISIVVTWAISQVFISRKVTDAIGDVKLEITKSISKVELSMVGYVSAAQRTDDRLQAHESRTAAQFSSANALSVEVLKTANNLIGIITVQNALRQAELEKNR